MSISTQKTKENYACMNRLLGREGRHNPCEPYKGNEQEFCDFTRYLEGSGDYDPRFDQFMPKEN